MDLDSIRILHLSSCLLQLYHLVGHRTYCIFSLLFTVIMPRKPGTLYILLGLITEPEARMDFVIMYIWVFHRALVGTEESIGRAWSNYVIGQNEITTPHTIHIAFLFCNHATEIWNFVYSFGLITEHEAKMDFVYMDLSLRTCRDLLEEHRPSVDILYVCI